MQKIYLAGPFFNQKETALIHAFAARLREKYEAFVPMEHTAEGDVPEGSLAWGKEIFDIDVRGLEGADLVVALDHGFTSDAGTAWETGYLPMARAYDYGVYEGYVTLFQRGTAEAVAETYVDMLKKLKEESL